MSTAKRHRRLGKDIQQVIKADDPQISIHLVNGSTHDIKALLIPVCAPYAGGMYSFSLKFPENYPDSPPSCQITTTNRGVTRFNPNLYAGGKVCLSILGTFSGPSWSSVLNLSTILQSILSLFCETPFTNEPSFENLKHRNYAQLSDRYNEKITHENLRISRVEELLALSDADLQMDPFATPILATFLQRKHLYLATCDAMKHLDGKAFQTMPFEFPANQMSGTFSFSTLAKRITAVHEALVRRIRTPVTPPPPPPDVSHLAYVESFTPPPPPPPDVSHLAYVESFTESPRGTYTAVVSGPPDTPWRGISIPVRVTWSGVAAVPCLAEICCEMVHPLVHAGVPFIPPAQTTHPVAVIEAVWEAFKGFAGTHHPLAVLCEQAEREMRASGTAFCKRAREMAGGGGEEESDENVGGAGEDDENVRPRKKRQGPSLGDVIVID